MDFPAPLSNINSSATDNGSIFKGKKFLEHTMKLYFLVDFPITMCDQIKDNAMSRSLHRWIFIGSNAYDEYVFVPWLNRNVYLRTVDLSRVCVQ